MSAKITKRTIPLPDSIATRILHLATKGDPQTAAAVKAVCHRWLRLYIADLGLSKEELLRRYTLPKLSIQCKKHFSSAILAILLQPIYKQIDLKKKELARQQFRDYLVDLKSKKPSASNAINYLKSQLQKVTSSNFSSQKKHSNENSEKDTVQLLENNNAAREQAAQSRSISVLPYDFYKEDQTQMFLELIEIERFDAVIFFLYFNLPFDHAKIINKLKENDLVFSQITGLMIKLKIAPNLWELVKTQDHESDRSLLARYFLYITGLKMEHLINLGLNVNDFKTKSFIVKFLTSLNVIQYLSGVFAMSASLFPQDTKDIFEYYQLEHSLRFIRPNENTYKEIIVDVLLSIDFEEIITADELMQHFNNKDFNSLLKECTEEYRKRKKQDLANTKFEK